MMHQRDISKLFDLYSLSDEKPTVVTNMIYRRRRAASLVLNDETLWITGGMFDDETYNDALLSSSEFIKIGESIQGPFLPTSMAKSLNISHTVGYL